MSFSEIGIFFLLIRYQENGTAVAILFRGLPNRNERDFSEWVNNLGYKPFSYVGGVTARNEIEPNVAEGAQDENVVTIEPHNEMAYATKYPKVSEKNSIYSYFKRLSFKNIKP